MEADGGVISAEDLLAEAWDENADPFTNSPRVTVSHLRKKLGEPRIVHTVAAPATTWRRRNDEAEFAAALR
nr:helix-turn-helix domain-containing protein [Corynebacterium guaraldiae]